MERNNFFSVILLSQILLLSLFLISSMATDSSSSDSEAKVHIIYTEKPKDGQEPEQHHIKTLASVLGSEDAAKQAILYSYKHAASGFSAKLTPQQVEELQKQPGVLQVVPSQTLQLHSGPGIRHG